MPTDRAQDTEARELAARISAPYGLLAEYPADAFEALDRLVARLEAAEQERDEAKRELVIVERVSQRNANAHMDAERRVRAALAAAAPGETTAVPGRYQGGTDAGAASGETTLAEPDRAEVQAAVLPADLSSGSASAAPGETEQTP